MGFDKNFDESYQLDWLKQWSRYTPRAVAFKDAETGVEWTYSELYFLSCQLGRYIKTEFGVGIGDRVAVMATNSMEHIALFFALQRIGAFLVPVNFRLTAREVEHIVEDASASVLILQRQFEGLLQKLGNFSRRVWWYDGQQSLTEKIQAWHQEFVETRGEETVRFNTHAWEEPFAGDPSTGAMILYTSGTTGAPKGAVITNSMLHWNSVNTALRLNITPNDAHLSFLPFFHTGGWNVLVTPYVHWGARTILVKKFDADMILDLVEKERVTMIFGVPTTMDMLHKSPRFEQTDFKNVRYAIVGGEPMSIELIRIWQQKGVPIRQGFGMTEFGPNVFSLNEEDSIRKIGSIGFPNFYVETRIVDDNGRECEIDEIGELLLRGPVCMPGYWKNPKASEETIRDGWLHTGDLVRRDHEGYFFVAGRKKDMFKSGGENVYPVEIEQVISTLPQVREVAVVGVPDPKWGEVGRAFICFNEDESLSPDEIRAHCEKNLAKFKVPKFIVIRKDLPKGDSGKILKRQLAAEPISI